MRSALASTRLICGAQSRPARRLGVALPRRRRGRPRPVALHRHDGHRVDRATCPVTPRSRASGRFARRPSGRARVDGMTALRVWAPTVSRGRASAPAAPTRRSSRPTTAGGPAPTSRPAPTTRFLLDDSDEPVPDPASRWQPEGVHGPSRVYDQDAYEWHDADWAGRDLTAAVVYELHVGTFTPGRHLRLRDRAARPPRRPRRHARRAAAGQRASTACGTGATTASTGTPCTSRYGGPDGAQALRRRRARQGSGRRARRRLQPPRAVRELPAALRPVPQDRPQHLGRPRQRRGAGRAPLHHRQRPDVAARLPRRRAAPGRRARPAGRVPHAHPGRARRPRSTTLAARSAGR